MTPHSLTLGPRLRLPLEAVTETVAILGIRGSGKTNTAVCLAEELLAAGQQVVAIDPTDCWWGLKSSADGQQPGYPVVIFGGRHGDVPLQAADGATIADFVVEERVPAILSLRHLESQADMRRLVTDFARRLYHRKGEAGHDTPLMLIIDEAHLFVPQRVESGEAPMVGAIQRLVRQGRASGLGVTVIDQRASSVNKDILTQLELLICHRTSSPQDRKALDAWVEQHDTADRRRAFLDQLASLPRGTAWCWSPGWLDLFQQVAVRARRTFDSSATPKAGARLVEPTTLAPVDLDRLRVKLATQLERAKTDDPNHAKLIGIWTVA
jgi:DNA helicase HerA-like ATPase